MRFKNTNGKHLWKKTVLKVLLLLMKMLVQKNTAEIEMELKDFGFHQEKSKLTKKKEMELADLMNVDLTAWKTEDLTALLLNLKLKATGTNPDFQGQIFDS